jgi:branched-chain amino acid transport system permease protein
MQEIQRPAAAGSRRRALVKWIVGASVVATLACLPFGTFSVPILLPGPVSSSASLLIVATGLVFATLAISYDVLFGYAGLLSAGHALVFALGAYLTVLLMETMDLSYLAAAIGAVVITTALSAVFGSVALRARAIAFTMVTLAFAEMFYISLLTDPFHISGGDEGLSIPYDQVPDFLVDARNVSGLYWVTLGFAIFTYLAALIATRSRCGRVWQAIRENEDRVEVLGLVPFSFKLLAFTFSSALAAGGGAVYVLVIGGATPAVASVQFSLGLIVMVVLGGTGRLWGAALGAMIYAILTLRLSALSASPIVLALPDSLGTLISQPLFILGLVFVLVVLFAPQGIAGFVDRIKPRPHESEVAAYGSGSSSDHHSARTGGPDDEEV